MMFLRGKLLRMFLAAAAGPLAASGCQSHSGDPRLDDSARRITRVEKGLLPPVLIRGRRRLTHTLAERMGYYNVPGVSVAVINGYEIDWAKGYGVANAGTGEPVTSLTLFQAASISKPVAAMAALRFVEEGRLELDGDVNDRLISWKLPKGPYTAQRPVTLRQLLSHTAGLTVHGFPGYAADAPLPSLQQILDGAAPANTAPIRSDLEPGSQWRYSGGGFTVLQQLLIDVAGRPFAEIIQQTVFEPLGMAESTYEQPLPPARARQAASAHRPDGAVVDGRWHTYPELAAAGLWTTPTDLARFAIEIQKSLRGESNRVLSRAMTEAMLTPGLEDWGLGFSLQGAGSSLRFWHGGSNEGFSCGLVAWVDGGQGAVVMTNSDRGGPLIDEIIQALAAEYGWPGVRPREREVVRLDPSRYDALVGSYQVADASITFIVSREGDQLFVEAPGSPRIEIFPESDSVFFSLGDVPDLTFVGAGREGAVLIGRNLRAERVDPRLERR